VAKQNAGQEAEVNIKEAGDDLIITVSDYLKVTGRETEAGNTTYATTHGNIMLKCGYQFSMNLWGRGKGANRPRRNVTLS